MRWLIPVMVAAAAAALAPAAEAPLAPAQPPVLLTHAGVSLSLPEGFAVRCPAELHEVLRAERAIQGQPRKTLML